MTGNVEIKRRGQSQFSLKANLPDGIRTISVNGEECTFVETNGRRYLLPPHTAVNEGIPVIPQMLAEEALSKSTTGISITGPTETGGVQTYDILLEPQSEHPQTLSSSVLTRRVLLDGKAERIIKVSQKAFTNYRSSAEFERSFEFEDYVPMNGVMVPSLIREKFGYAKICEIRITSLSNEDSLTEADFSTK
jgi:hypothetical protein